MPTIAAATSTQPAVRSSSTSSMLQRGSRGPEVLELQKALRAAGFDPKGLDGSFGPKTEAAVKAFQRAKGLVVDGKVGPQTWGALRALSTPAPTTSTSLRKGSSGPEVLKLQKALNAAGFDPKGLDGKFGPKTEAALKAFQQANGLPATGVAGPESWAAFDFPRNPPTPAPTTPTPAPTTPASTMLSLGASGPDVLKLQQALLAAGFDPKGLDGKFGPKTEAALKAYQASRGLTVDGRAGPQTWAALSAGAPPAVTPAPSGDRAARINTMLAWAKTMLGTPYAAVNPFRFGEVLWDGKAHPSVNGSKTVWQYPKGTRVFDCSGFVVAAYRQLGVDLAKKGLASSWAFDADTSFLQPLSREQLQPGDLIIYQPKNGIGHVVIYMGNGQAIESKGGQGVVMGPVDWNRAKSYRRVPLP